MPAQPPPPQTVRSARAAFFTQNDFGDGGYDQEFAEAQFGPLAYRVPNPEPRANALRLHDLHHVVTGYETDWRGEAEISAWELASGLGAQPWAWMIMLWGMFTGLVLAPRVTVRAFLRGRRSRNLYGRPFDSALLDQDLVSLKTELGLVPSGADPWDNASWGERAGDVLALLGAATASMAYGVVGLVPSLGLVAYAWVGELGRLTRFMRCNMTPC
ncbi:MAG: hypothetical protein KDA24_24355 [Deltaproteobacteria bacterium]|nr:hypothetical protein [Deltaproteobacteria bacterium]